MDLWIRSSDKEILLKANKIKYGHYKPFGSDYYTEVISINDELIEEYETKERALEVLDDIQRWISGEIITKKLNQTNGNMDNVFPTIVYEMPKE